MEILMILKQLFLASALSAVTPLAMSNGILASSPSIASLTSTSASPPPALPQGAATSGERKYIPERIHRHENLKRLDANVQEKPADHSASKPPPGVLGMDSILSATSAAQSSSLREQILARLQGLRVNNLNVAPEIVIDQSGATVGGNNTVTAITRPDYRSDNRIDSSNKIGAGSARWNDGKLTAADVPVTGTTPVQTGPTSGMTQEQLIKYQADEAIRVQQAANKTQTNNEIKSVAGGAIGGWAAAAAGGPVGLGIAAGAALFKKLFKW